MAQELAPITAQLAFVACALGRRDEAREAYKAVLGALGGDAGAGEDATAAVAAANLSALALAEAGAGGAGGRKAAAECLRRLEACVERSGERRGWQEGWQGGQGGPARREGPRREPAAAALRRLAC